MCYHGTMGIVTKEVDNSKARDDMWATVYAQVFSGLIVGGVTEEVAAVKARRAADAARETIPKTIVTLVAH